MSVDFHLVEGPTGGATDAEFTHLTDYSDEKWPVWLRLIVIIGLSAALWTGIISIAVTIFT
jgi:hypothetical protein